MSLSFVAASVRTPVLRALPIRNLTALTAAGIAALALTGLRQDSLHILPAPAPAPVVVEAAAPVAAPVVAVSKGPSVFDIEESMSTRELIERWNPIIQSASKRFGVPEAWIKAVIRAESGGRTQLVEGQPVVSSAGAMGLMQIMPDTYAILRAEYKFGTDPFDPYDNIHAGTAYLKWLHGKFGNPGMFAAYNAGPGRLDSYIAGKSQLPAETRAYVFHIARTLNPGQTPFEVGVAKLTMPNGTPVTIETKTVTAVRAALPGEFAPGVQSVVKMGTRMQAVREDLATATQAIRAAGLSL